MIRKKSNSLHILVAVICILMSVVAGVGLFYMNGVPAYDFVNQFGDVVAIYGRGIYAHDSLFKATIYRGTDFIVVFFIIPLLVYALYQDRKKGELHTRMLLTSILSYCLYHSASVAFHAVYNRLFIVYLVLFSASLYAFIMAVMSIAVAEFPESTKKQFPSKGVILFLVLSGLSLFVAWMPDMIRAFVENRPVEWIEIYSTEVTFLIDIGVIVPQVLACIYLLSKKSSLGYALLGTSFFSLASIGVIVISQSVFQTLEGVALSLPVIITKIGIFTLFGGFAFYYMIKFMKSLKE